MDKAAKNTDRELWRECEGDYYADFVFVTEGGGIGMNAGGKVVVKSVREWVSLALGKSTADLKFQIELEREACAQVALCLGEDAGTAIAAGIRARDLTDYGTHPMMAELPAERERNADKLTIIKLRAENDGLRDGIKRVADRIDSPARVPRVDVVSELHDLLTRTKALSARE